MMSTTKTEQLRVWEKFTHNGILFPQNRLNNYIHSVLNKMGTNPNVFKHITNTETGRFVNTAEGIDFSLMHWAMHEIHWFLGNWKWKG